HATIVGRSIPSYPPPPSNTENLPVGQTAIGQCWQDCGRYGQRRAAVSPITLHTSEHTNPRSAGWCTVYSRTLLATLALLPFTLSSLGCNDAAANGPEHLQ